MFFLHMEHILLHLSYYLNNFDNFDYIDYLNNFDYFDYLNNFDYFK